MLPIITAIFPFYIYALPLSALKVPPGKKELYYTTYISSDNI
jgi:hypothetical protein